MGFVVHLCSGFSIGGIHQTEDLARFLVDPVALVVDAVCILGREIGLTRERVRQIEAQALRRLRKPQIQRELRTYIE